MSQRFPLWKLILTVGGLALVLYSVFIPIWEGNDEPAHFCYVQYLAEQHAIPQPPGSDQVSYCSTEVENSLRALPLNNNLRLSPQLIDFKYTDYQTYWKTKIDQQPESVPAEASDRTTTHNILDIWQAQHPPLPYLVLVIPYLLTRQAGFYVQLLVLRLACVGITLLGMWVCWKALQRVVVSEGARIFGFIAVVSAPMFFVHFGRISNEPLTFLLFSLTWYFLLEILQAKKIQRRTALLLGLVYGLGFISKAFFLTGLPTLILIFIMDVWPYRKLPAERNQRLLNYALSLGGIAMFAVPWVLYQKFGVSSQGVGFSQLGDLGLGGVLLGLLHLPWTTFLREVFLNYVGLLGWSFLRAPLWFYAVNILFWYHTALGFFKLRGRELKIAVSALLFPLSILLGMAIYNLHFADVAITGGWYFYTTGAMLVTFLAITWNNILKERLLLPAALVLGWFNLTCLLWFMFSFMMPTYYAI